MWDGLNSEAKTVIFGLFSLEEEIKRAEAAARGEPQEPRIDFVSSDLFFRIMTAKRWEIIRAMAGSGPLSIREVARRVRRDVKGVHGDVRALLDCGVLSKTEAGQVIFPFKAVHVDFTLEAAA
jgi:predicted transcriptional regulator